MRDENFGVSEVFGRPFERVTPPHTSACIREIFSVSASDQSHTFSEQRSLVTSKQEWLWEAFGAVHKALGMPCVPVCNRGQGQDLFSSMSSILFLFCFCFFSDPGSIKTSERESIDSPIDSPMNASILLLNSSMVISNMVSVLNNWIWFSMMVE